MSITRRIAPQDVPPVNGNGGLASAPAEGALRALVRAFGMLERVMNPHFASFGLSASQWGVLRALHRVEDEGLEGLRLTDLSQRLLVRPPSVTGVVARLERAGLVVRDASRLDHREKQVRLTPAGRERLRRVLDVHGQQTELVMAGLGPSGCRQLQALLERLDGHLESLLVQGGEKPAPLQQRAGQR